MHTGGLDEGHEVDETACTSKNTGRDGAQSVTIVLELRVGL